MGIKKRYKLLTERTHYMAPAAGIGIRAVLKGTPDIDSLRNAVLRAMKRNAILCCRVVQDKDGTVYYEYTGEPVVMIQPMYHAEDTLWESILKEQEHLFFDLQKGELLRIFVMGYDNKTELFIISHHLAGDGESLLCFLKDVLQLLDSGTADIIPERPVQIFDRTLFPARTKLKMALRIITALINREWRKKGHIFTWEEYKSFFEEYWKEHKTAVYTGIIEENDLRKLIIFSKKNGITLNSLLSTAVFAVDGGGLGIPVSVRPADFQGMGNYASGITVEYKYDQELNFAENAKKVHQLIYEEIKDNGHKYFLLRFLSSLEGGLIDAAFHSAYGRYEQKTAMQAAEMFGFCGVSNMEGLTNLKNVDWIGQYNKYPVCELQFIPPLAPNTKYMIGIITYSGRMCMTFHYPDYGDNRETVKVFENIMDRLGSLS